MEKVKSDTIWNKEIYNGFKQLLQKIYGEKFNVVICKPDEDFKIEEFPCAVLQIPTYKFSIDRWSKIDRYVAGRDENNNYVIDSTPLPFDVYLQMDFYTKFQDDIDTLQIKWLSKFGRDLMLEVETRGGKPSSVLVLPEGGAKRLDEVTGKERLFRLVQNFRVFARIDEHDNLEKIRIPDKIKFIFEHMKKGVGVNEVPVNKHIGTTPGVYTIRQ